MMISTEVKGWMHRFNAIISRGTGTVLTWITPASPGFTQLLEECDALLPLALARSHLVFLSFRKLGS